jgi:hypothetical protein
MVDLNVNGLLRLLVPPGQRITLSADIFSPMLSMMGEHKTPGLARSPIPDQNSLVAGGPIVP